MYKIPTIDGKEIQISNAYLEVSDNHLSERGYVSFLVMDGTLPKGRKCQRLSYTVGFNKIFIMNLFNTNKWIDVAPEEFLKFLKQLEVKKYRWDTTPLTQEQIDYARTDIEGVCSCPVVKGLVK